MKMTSVVASVALVAAAALLTTSVSAEARTATLTCPSPYRPTRMTIGGFQALVCATPTPRSVARPTSGETTIPGDGTFLVPRSVKPGTYESGKPSRSCYWARLKKAGGDGDNINANNISTGPSVVTIQDGDGAFETSGCATWKLVP